MCSVLRLKFGSAMCDNWGRFVVNRAGACVAVGLILRKRVAPE